MNMIQKLKMKVIQILDPAFQNDLFLISIIHVTIALNLMIAAYMIFN